MPTMTTISKHALNRAIKKALLQTYLRALRARTPATWSEGARTGETARGWELKNPRLLQFVFVNDRMMLAEMFDKGWKGGIIKGNPWLAFPKPPYKKRRSPYKKIDGNQAFEKDGMVFAKMVRHPGFKAHHYLTQIARDKTLEAKFYNALSRELGLA